MAYFPGDPASQSIFATHCPNLAWVNSPLQLALERKVELPDLVHNDILT
jgi:hypothetical protein